MIRHFFLVLDFHQLLLASLCWRSQCNFSISQKALSPLTRHYGTGRSTPFGRTCRAFQCALDLVLEPLATQRPAAVNSISNLAKFARIQLATEKLPVSLLPFLCCAAERLVLLVGRKQFVRCAVGMKPVA